MPNYKLCPKCELNMIEDHQILCDSCAVSLPSTARKRSSYVKKKREEIILPRALTSKSKFNVGLKPGDVIDNNKLVSIFLCSTQGGMRRSIRTKSLVLVKKRVSIYADTWQKGICYYTGMGQEGDQKFSEAQNKTLFNLPYIDIEAHLFEENNSQYTYLGKVVLASEPYFSRQPDVLGRDRRVCIFPIRSKIDDNDMGYIPAYNACEIIDNKK